MLDRACNACPPFTDAGSSEQLDTGLRVALDSDEVGGVKGTAASGAAVEGAPVRRFGDLRSNEPETAARGPNRGRKSV